jgi:peroxiredoxin
MHSKIKAPIAVVAVTIAALVLVACSAETQQPTKTAKPTTNGPSCDPKVGAVAPKLAIDVNGGGKASIATGKVTLVDFWAPWCEPCKASFPKYQDLYSKYKARGFEVIAIAVDDEKNELPGFVKKYGAKFPVGLDRDHELAGCWKPANMPSSYIIDKKGVVRHIHNQWHPGDEAKVEEQIKALL